ncbi:unnamed protein product [Ectocarpus sp. CCAP 1310/34]|nr:unnamed protein product [Ectocarpus sp. CCAP 1310/34]
MATVPPFLVIDHRGDRGKCIGP